MVTMNDTAAAAATPVPVLNPNNQETKSTDYEKCREERIKENLERMQKLGIYDLSLKMKSVKPNSYRKNNKPLSTTQNNKTPNHCIPLMPSSVPTRRSSRLQSTPAVTYCEVDVPKKGKDCNELWIEKTCRPEVYTEEQEKLLGDCNTEWTLFVDGYGKDGKRIYDQVRGKTCHQCRQKTLGHRTHCIKCNMVQGQFCGDCLYMRYGENVLEAKQNPDWICPPCRGICNCSLCRQAKGWAPTGMLYRKISSQGYKSVAHYLIQNFRSEKNEKTDTQVCAKRALPFSREETDSEDIHTKTKNIESSHKNAEAEVNTDEKPTENIESTHKDAEAEVNTDEMPTENMESTHKNAEAEVNTDEKPTENIESTHKNAEAEVNTDVKPESDQGSKENNPQPEVNEFEVQLELTNVECKVNNNTDDEVKTVILTPETKPGSRKKRDSVVLADSIGARLRSRRRCA